MKSWEQVRKNLLEDDSFRHELDASQPEYEMIRQIIKARIEQNLSQKELAEKAGTDQAHISRLESGRYNPSVSYLKRIADGLGMDIKIIFSKKTAH